MLKDFRIASEDSGASLVGTMGFPIGEVVKKLNDSGPRLLGGGVRAISESDFDMGEDVVIPTAPLTPSAVTRPTSKPDGGK